MPLPTATEASPAPQDGRDGLHAVLTRAVGRFCPPALRHLKDDLVQNAWIRVLEVQRRSEGDRPLSSSYLYKVAYSALIDEIRRLRRRGEVALEDAPREPVARRGNPEQETEMRVIGQGIQDCLQRTGEDRRMAVTLYLAGHTVAEAARVLGWSPKRTENLVYRGLADLRACLDAKGLKP